MKKLFTLLTIVAISTAAFAQSPFATNANGLSVVFCSNVSASDTSYIIHGSTNGLPYHQESETSEVTIVDGALKLEGFGDNWAHVRFKISPDYTSYLDVTGGAALSFKYKELNAEAMPAVIRCDASEGINSYGAEQWLEGDLLTFNSTEWVTFSSTTDAWILEDWDPTKVTMLELALDGGDVISNPSVIIDDIVFGNIELQVCETSANEVTFKPKMGVYPNPATDIIRFKNAGPEFEVAIFNTLGQQMIFEKNPAQMDISELNSGLYLIKVYNSKDKETFKLLVK